MVEDVKPLASGGPAIRRSPTPLAGVPRPERDGREGAETPGDENAASAEAEDVALLQGVDERALPPEARSAFLELVSEVADLRQHLAQTRDRIAYLQHLLDRDPMAPVLNRRGLARELAHVLSLAARHETESTLCYFRMEGLAAINAQYGHAVGDAAVELFGAALDAAIRPGDVVGRLGGSEFAAILVGYAVEEGRARAREIAADVGRRVIHWGGRPIHFQVAWAVHPLRPGQDVATALRELDHDVAVRPEPEATAGR
ncbi:MAG: GGDEF domain-containing protein [Alphaproteobacteria bacterium]